MVRLWQALEKLGVTVDSRTLAVHELDEVKLRGPPGALLDIGLPAGPTRLAMAAPWRAHLTHLLDCQC